MYKLLLALILSCAVCDAGPLTNCIPILFPDEQPIDSACPQIGAPVIPITGSAYSIAFEDLPRFVGSRDFNDLIATVDFGATFPGFANFTYVGHSSILFDELVVDGVTAFDTFGSLPGDVDTVPLAGLTFFFRATYPGYGAFTYNVGSQNVWASCLSGCPPSVPEPSTNFLFSAGLVLLIGGLVVRRKLRW